MNYWRTPHVACSSNVPSVIPMTYNEYFSLDCVNDRQRKWLEQQCQQYMTGPFIPIVAGQGKGLSNFVPLTESGSLSLVLVCVNCILVFHEPCNAGGNHVGCMCLSSTSSTPSSSELNQVAFAGMSNGGIFYHFEWQKLWINPKALDTSPTTAWYVVVPFAFSRTTL
jgi:hypothetical protein